MRGSTGGVSPVDWIRGMQAAHARLDVTDEAFDRVMDHLIATLVDLGVSRELIREVAWTLTAAAQRTTKGMKP